MTENVLEVEDLHTVYHTRRGDVHAVDHVSFSLKRGEWLGLVGESGSGKSTIAFSILRLIKPPGEVIGGSVRLRGKDLLKLSENSIRELRLSKISMIPQGAMNSLNPVAKVKDQIFDGISAHSTYKKRKTFHKAEYFLDRVGLSPSVANMYPHELSGGMKQRVTIAIATSMDPELIIADEPTSALDVVVQRQVIETLVNLQKELQASIILIGHDMGLMAQVAEKIGVMYSGKMVEIGTAREVLKDPYHPYSNLLIKSIPSLMPKANAERDKRFRGIPGTPPSLTDLPNGCYFNPRCPEVMDICRQKAPLLENISAEEDSRRVSCHLYHKTVIRDA